MVFCGRSRGPCLATATQCVLLQGCCELVGVQPTGCLRVALLVRERSLWSFTPLTSHFPSCGLCRSPFVRTCHSRGQGCIRREGASEAEREAVRQAVGGGCQSGWGRLLSVTNATEQLPDELKQRHEKERPAPVKSVVRPTDTRWASQFDAYKYWRGRISAFKKFLSEMLQDLSDPPPTAQALLALLTDAVRLTALKVQIAFTCESMQPIYDLILSFQKQTGGPADPLGAHRRTG